MASDDSRRAPLTDSVSLKESPFTATALRIDDACALHQFSVHKLDAGPVRLMTIAHVFNYRMAVLPGRSEIGCSCRQIPEGGGALSFGLRHSMGPTGVSTMCPLWC